MDISSIMMTSASRGFFFISVKMHSHALGSFPDLGAPGITGGVITRYSPPDQFQHAVDGPGLISCCLRHPLGRSGIAGRCQKYFHPSISKYRMIVLMVVVLPVPGPPVITNSPLFTASYTAFPAVHPGVWTPAAVSLEDWP